MSHHGTRGRYQKGCRCDPCIEAQARQTAEQRQKRLERAEKDPALIPHGTNTGYVNWRCRCRECIYAGSAYQRQRRAKARKR